MLVKEQGPAWEASEGRKEVLKGHRSFGRIPASLVPFIQPARCKALAEGELYLLIYFS